MEGVVPVVSHRPHQQGLGREVATNMAVHRIKYDSLHYDGRCFHKTAFRLN